jgi:hypothetical protein
VWQKILASLMLVGKGENSGKSLVPLENLEISERMRVIFLS